MGSLALVVFSIVAPSVSASEMRRQSDPVHASIAIGSHGSFSAVAEKGSGEQGRGEQGRAGIISGARIFLGIKSAPSDKYRKRREVWRNSDCPKKYRAANISYAFFMGMPLDPGHDLTGHNQGGLETAHERALEEELIAESATYEDIQFLMFRDVYMDLPNKLMGILSNIYYKSDSEYIGEHDDDYCVEPQVILVTIAEQKKSRNAELWIGAYLFKGDEYASMKGPNNMTAQYFSGNGAIMSRGLVKPIVVDNFPLVVQHGEYGTVSDDANLGKWVSFAVEKQNLTLDYVEKHEILTEVA